MTVLEYLQPESLDEAIALLGRHGADLLVMAGGTVAMPLVNEGISLPERVMGLRRAGLDHIARRDGELRIGATATLGRVLEAAIDASDVPLLADAIRSTGSWAVRNLGTIGGNLFTPPPGGDVAVALLALGARVRLAGPGGERDIALEDFFTGYLATALAPDELVAEVIVPLNARRAAFRKLGRKAANTPAVVTVAITLRQDDGRTHDARIALGAVGPHPFRATAAEAALEGRALDGATIEAAARAAAEASRPVDDPIASAWYRRRMVEVIVRRVLESLA